MTVALPVDPSVIGGLRRARRRRRLAAVDLFEALYQAYLAALAVGIIVALGSGVTGDARLGPSALNQVRTHGAAAVGLAVAVAVAVALRSGGRGGPLAVEAADVTHVLLAPVDRRAALAGPAIQQLRFGAFAGGTAGAVVGLIAYRRLPGTPGAWVLWGALVGGLAAVAALGAAMAASGRRLSRYAANGLAVVVLGWSAADLALGVTTSPFTLLGRLSLWALGFDWTALGGAVVALLLAALGLALVGGLSLEAAERRSRLVGQLRFAATVRDLRAVMLLRRQLAQERPRTRPWVRLATRPGSGTGLAVWTRGWCGILRWPARRVARLVLLGAAAGVSLRGVWAGTAPLVVVAGLALWLAALDAVEPLAQEVDNADRRDSYPRAEGWIEVRHLAVSCVVMAAVGVVGIGAALPLGQIGLVLGVGGSTLLPAVTCAVAGAAVSVVRAPPLALVGNNLMPELTGLRALVRELVPPVLATAGLLPVLAARAVVAHHYSPTAAAANVAVLLLFVPVAVGAWVHTRGQVAAVAGIGGKRP
jgi:hypothetical protein